MRGVELEADERLLTAARPHPIVLAAPLAKALGGLAVILVLFLGWHSAPAWFGLVLAACFLAALGYIVAQVLTWRAGLVVVTSQRVIQRSGLVHRVGREIPIHKIADVASRQGPLGQLLGYGELVVESIGASTARPIPAVRAPERVQHAIHQAERVAALGRFTSADRQAREETHGLPPEPPDAAQSGGDVADW